MSNETNTTYSIINGQSHQSTAMLDVRNPVDNALIARVSEVDEHAAERAIKCANNCFIELKSTTAQARGDTLFRWYQLILQNKKRLAELVTREQGKPLKEALAEVMYAAGYVKWFSQEAERTNGAVIPAQTIHHQLRTLKQGIGVVVGITPWNFPLAMITRKVAPAYAAGCSFILKPSELTPLSAIELAKLALEAGFEPGAFQILITSKPQDLVTQLNSHPSVRKLTFTGSTAVGKLLLEQTARSVMRTSLELGGNAPFIVFESADLEAALEGLMMAKFRNAGQTCIAANRVYLHSAIKSQFIEMLKSRLQTLVIGDGLGENVDLGPLINSAAKQKALSLLDDACKHGANIVYQGESQTGNYLSPVILENVEPAMAIYNTEIFAPIVSVIEFQTEEQVVNMANDVDVGLAAYVYSSNIDLLHRVSMVLDFAMIGINEGAISNPAAPFGGMKQSGLGREGGAEGIDEYLEVKYLCQRF
ncbi:succinate-semialdehyde dehydrogenase (NADP(+)) [Pseudoalteromonas luteoviolacea]|uniref:Succinate-semialdehyde dehydrogenase (NADP(+)) n=1 Tax=Pseudoalteromonas luteoviolacea TaxID=43657 RepID=A0A1C0TJ00_9GAMM|nr:NAD-dependent succinate-semialdehyde dehydrogenase [Pseudoalteromonas luteoviolacea]OCQ18168.1 succinate-semialdehyde dehydrogenase (NADP(+)) [Pseudoalteromonas luteoviolacea]